MTNMLLGRYADGSIRAWNIEQTTFPLFLMVTEQLWHSINLGMRGHKDQVTAIRFISKPSLDGTIIVHRGEIWDFDVTKDVKLIVTGSDDDDLKLWTVDHDVLAQGLESEIKLNDENKKKIARRKKRQKEKKQKAGEDSNMDIDDDLTEINVSDMLTPYHMVRRYDRLIFHQKMILQDLVLMSLTNNTLELYTIGLKKKDKLLENAILSKLYSIDLPGHRNDIRTLTLSFDDELLCSASKSTLKLWNMRTTSCLRTIDCGYALCSNNRYKTWVFGIIFNIASSSQIESIEAHDGPIWSLQVRPDKRELVTGKRQMLGI
ncbi:3963_t:CDS:2 [Scutellospora calospora]|uniref:3963_t:CDS:1 n=1 Tax=Scutellospora calospora TaxID=85575 RepID=A0ACA9JXS3_9GLOM|nr:3963_t:CDS:2 [Scutellospora calospora]